MNEELKIIISAQVDKLNQAVGDAKNQISSFKDEVTKASGDVDSKISGLGSSIANGLTAGLTAIAGIGTALVALGASTAEYRAEQAKLESAFQTVGASAETAKTTYNDLYRVLGDSGVAVEASGHLAKLTTDQQSLSEWTTICQGVYATFGDSIPIEGLTEAANETAKTGALTGGLADALNWAGVAEDDFQAKLDACNTEAEREALIRETLTGLYGEAAAAYETNAAGLLAQNEAQAALQENLALLGEAVAPIVAAFTAFAADALAVVVPYIQELAEQYMPALSAILDTVTAGLEASFKWVMEHKNVLAVLGGIIGTIVTAIGLYNAIAAIKTAMAAAEVTSVWALVAAYAAQAVAVMAALAPYIAIVAAIAAVIAIIVVCVKHWDDIKEAVAKAWEWIQEKTKAAVDKVVEFFTNLKDKTQEKITALKDKVVEIFTNIKMAIEEKIQAAKDKVVELFTNIKTSIEENIQAAKEKVTSIFEAIKTGISEKINSAKSTVSSVFTNIKTTIQSNIETAKNKVTSVFDAIKSGISDKINAAKDAVKSAIDKIKGFFNFTWELPKIKLPHFKISGKFSLDPPSIPKFSVDWYARGGVFDNPTLFGYGGRIGGLGEAGAEAVVPLENNLGWLDKLAGMLNDRLGASNTPVVLQVDGKTFAETSISTINQLTKQTGKLPLVIA